MGEMIRLRKRHKALSRGSYRTLLKQGAAVLFERRQGEERLWVAVNIDPKATRLPLPPAGFEPKDDAGARVIALASFGRNGRLAGDTLELPGFGFALIQF
jgi:glycosidase